MAIVAPLNLALPLQCGSCWAFAAAAAFESKLAIEKGISWDQSVQQLIDCVSDPQGSTPRSGCGPGFSTDAMSYLAAQGGVSTPNYKSYRAQKDSCNSQLLSGLPPSSKYRLASSPGYKDIQPNSATELMKVVIMLPKVLPM
jgi:cathepsin L